MTDAENTPAVPPAQPATPAAVPAETAPPAKKRRALGAWSFVLALLAVIGDLIVTVMIVVAVVGGINTVSSTGSFDGIGEMVALLGAGLVFAGIVFIGGLLFALLSILLAIIGFVRRSGIVLGVFGVILSLGVLAVHLSILGALLAAGQGIAGLGGVLGGTDVSGLLGG